MQGLVELQPADLLKRPVDLMNSTAVSALLSAVPAQVLNPAPDLLLMNMAQCEALAIATGQVPVAFENVYTFTTGDPAQDQFNSAMIAGCLSFAEALDAEVRAFINRWGGTPEDVRIYQEKETGAFRVGFKDEET